MKKLIIISISIFIAVIGAAALVRYINSFNSVKISVVDPATTVSILDEDKKVLSKVEGQESTINLQSGTYFYKVEGEKYDASTTEFTVNDDTSIKIDPPYSKAYLAKQLKTQDLAIKQAIRAYKPSVISKYTIQSGELYGKGEWYGTILTENHEDPRYESDAYRVLVGFEDGKWKVVRYPEIVLTAANYPQVPKYVLSAINSQPYNY